MKDLSVVGDTQYIMNGDFFMDVLCSALYFNKQLIENMMGDPDIIYKKVLTENGPAMSSSPFPAQDIRPQRQHQPDMGDLWGFTCIGMWVPHAVLVCGDLEFVSRDPDGSINGYALNNERGAYLCYANDVFHDLATNTDRDIPSLVANFTSPFGIRRLSAH